MGLVSSDKIRIKMEFLSPLGWFLDCITCIVKNTLLLRKNRNKSTAQKK
jgi:hypothetical protein